MVTSVWSIQKPSTVAVDEGPSSGKAASAPKRKLPPGTQTMPGCVGSPDEGPQGRAAARCGGGASRCASHATPPPATAASARRPAAVASLIPACSEDHAIALRIGVPGGLQFRDLPWIAVRQISLLLEVAAEVEQLPPALRGRRRGIPHQLPVALAHAAMAE